MDAATFLALASVCAPHVRPSTAKASAQVESSLNPNAIGVLHAALARQPNNPTEALTTARALRSEGCNFSVGLAQINLHNPQRLELSLEVAFEPRRNLSAMQTAIRECAQRVGTASDAAQRNLCRTLYRYYSGDAVGG